MNDKRTIANGVSCLIAQLVSEFKDGVGAEWLEPLKHCQPRCNRCQGVLQTVNVNGHEQCVLCHQIIDDCCQGSPL